MRAYIILLTLTILLATTASSASIPDGGFSYYPLSSYIDQWGTFNATNNGVGNSLDFPTFNTTGDAAPNSSNFTGSDSDFTLGTPNFANYSVSIWAKFPSSDPNEMKTISSVEGNNHKFNIRLDDGTSCNAGDIFVTEKRGGDPQPTICSYNIGYDGAWHHIAITSVKNGDYKLYIDGQPNGTDTALNSNLSFDNMGNWVWGKHETDNTPSWDDQLDDLKIFDKELTAQEVSNEYNFGNIEGNTNLPLINITYNTTIPNSCIVKGNCTANITVNDSSLHTSTSWTLTSPDGNSVNAIDNELTTNKTRASFTPLLNGIYTFNASAKDNESRSDQVQWEQSIINHTLDSNNNEFYGQNGTDFLLNYTISPIVGWNLTSFKFDITMSEEGVTQNISDSSQVGFFEDNDSKVINQSLSTDTNYSTRSIIAVNASSKYNISLLHNYSVQSYITANYTYSYDIQSMPTHPNIYCYDGTEWSQFGDPSSSGNHSDAPGTQCEQDGIVEVKVEWFREEDPGGLVGTYSGDETESGYDVEAFFFDEEFEYTSTSTNTSLLISVNSLDNNSVEYENTNDTITQATVDLNTTQLRPYIDNHTSNNASIIPIRFNYSIGAKLTINNIQTILTDVESPTIHSASVSSQSPTTDDSITFTINATDNQSGTLACDIALFKEDLAEQWTNISTTVKNGTLHERTLSMDQFGTGTLEWREMQCYDFDDNRDINQSVNINISISEAPTVTGGGGGGITVIERGIISNTTEVSPASINKTMVPGQTQIVEFVIKNLKVVEQDVSIRLDQDSEDSLLRNLTFFQVRGERFESIEKLTLPATTGIASEGTFVRVHVELPASIEVGNYSITYLVEDSDGKTRPFTINVDVTRNAFLEFIFRTIGGSLFGLSSVFWLTVAGSLLIASFVFFVARRNGTRRNVKRFRGGGSL